MKDNIETVEWPTTGASKAFEGKFPTQNSSLVTKILEQGAVIVGKLNMHELAFGVTSNNGSFGPVKNPYDHTKIPGGSSGGTGAVIASGAIKIGFGSDTGGSCRIPASLCGVCGMRPSIGRYPGDGVINLSKTRDTVGPLATSVKGLKLVDQAVTGQKFEGELDWSSV